jgi:hypothetical protein
MPVRINPTAEPLSFSARTDTPPHPGGKPSATTILARSQAGDLLEHEMARYCDGLVRGRSFLVAGHRGSGKTTLIDQVVLNLQEQALLQQLRFKPLPIYIQGPLIFASDVEETPPVAAAAATTADTGGAAAAPAPAAASASAPALDPADDDERIQKRVLLQVAQGLHQAVAKEYVERFHLHARRKLAAGARNADDLVELAARFQIELTEAPPPSRLKEYWDRAGLTKEGLLFNPNNSRGSQQGLREMVVLTGVSHIYQRISGRLEEQDKQRFGQKRDDETTTGADAKWVELVKPLTAVVAGGAVGAAGAIGSSPVWAVVLGVLTALGTSLLFKATSTQTRSRERTRDHTFIPDLSIKTLHRVMPELFERLQAAGLAPVFIVDELDKVDNLYAQLQGLLDSLKKLFAERAFSCLVVERGFYEELHWREELERQGGSPAPAAASAAAGAGAAR